MRTDDSILDLAYAQIGTYKELRREVKELQTMLDNPSLLDEGGYIHYDGLDIDLVEKDIESLIANREDDMAHLKENLGKL